MFICKTLSGSLVPIPTLPLLGERKVLPSLRLITIELCSTVVPIDLHFTTKEFPSPNPPVRVSNLKIPPTLLVLIPDSS